MRIVHITYSYKGGAGRAAWRLHLAMLKAGFDSWFLTTDFDSPGPDLNWVSIREDIAIKKTPKYDLLGRYSNWIRNKLLKASKDMQQKVVAECITHPFSKINLWDQEIVQSADIVSLHWFSGPMFDYGTFFRSAKKPVVWTLHDQQAFLGLFHYQNDMDANAAHAADLDNKLIAYKKKAVAAIKTSLHIVTPSKWLQNEAALSAVFSKFPSTCIPYSLNLDMFRPFDRSVVRKELGLPLDAIIFLVVADRLNVYRKGLDLFDKALQLINESLNVTVVAIGKENDLSSRHYTLLNAGIIKDDEMLAKYYSAASAFVIPSREDNLPNVMLESFACGTPVIGFPIGGVAEHVSYPATGVLAKSLDAESLAEAIEFFIKNQHALKPDTIRAYAAQHFAPALQAARYFQLFKSLV